MEENEDKNRNSDDSVEVMSDEARKFGTWDVWTDAQAEHFTQEVIKGHAWDVDRGNPVVAGAISIARSMKKAPGIEEGAKGVLNAMWWIAESAMLELTTNPEADPEILDAFHRIWNATCRAARPGYGEGWHRLDPRSLEPARLEPEPLPGETESSPAVTLPAKPSR